MVILADSLGELQVKGHMWKSGMEKKGLRVNMGKMKIMVSGANMDLLKKSGRTSSFREQAATQYSVVAALSGTTKNGVASRGLFALTQTTSVLAVCASRRPHNHFKV